MKSTAAKVWVCVRDEIQHMCSIRCRGAAQVCEHLNAQEGVCRMQNVRVNVRVKDGDEQSATLTRLTVPPSVVWKKGAG